MRPPKPFHPLDSKEAFDAALAASYDEPVVLFKHSTMCPISAGAHDEMVTLAGDDDPPVYRLVVQQSRDLSQRVADTFGIRHESPQVIVVRDGEPVFHTSHGRITANSVRKAVRDAASQPAAS